MMYFPAKIYGAASSYGLPGAKDLTLTTSDGETIAAWYQPPVSGKNLFLMFHGNGGSLVTIAGLLRDLASDGSGFFAIDYRGYGRSSGLPTETGLLRDGEAAYAAVQKLGYPGDRVVIIGQSLGTGVAVVVANAHPVRAFVLDSAFSSSADVAAAEYWMFPVRLLMMDQFNSVGMIQNITAPKLFLHGDQDTMIAAVFTRKLFDKAMPPKTFIEIPGAGHLVLWRPDVLDRMRTWLASLPKATMLERKLVPVASPKSG